MDLELDPLNILAGAGVTARTHTEPWPGGSGVITFDVPAVVPDDDAPLRLSRRFDFDVVLTGEVAQDEVALIANDWWTYLEHSAALVDFLGSVYGSRAIPEPDSRTWTRHQPIYNEDDVVVGFVLNVSIRDFDFETGLQK